MFVSIVATALIMHYLFAALDITPESSRQVDEIAQFAFDYTLHMNIGFVLIGLVLHIAGNA